jgi:hypothetical protein
MKSLAACVGIALLQWGGSALADTAIGVDTALGNALNPPGRSGVPGNLAPDSDDTVRRTPTGQLYNVPREIEERNKTTGGWEYSAMVEGGLIVGDANQKNALLHQYNGMKEGPTLNYFELEADKPDSAAYLQTFGGGVGQKDQFYGVQFGRYNDWKVKLFYNETSHVFTDTWKSLFNGEGTGTLSTGLAAPTIVKTGSPTVGSGTCTALAPCWSYGGKTYSNATALAAINGIVGTANATTGVMPASGTTPQSGMAKAIADKLAAMPESELALVRKKAGARADMNITDNWKAYASYSQEARTGARPLAMNEGNISTEIAEPINYTTHEFLSGLQYADSLTQANLRASASLFRNNISTLNVQYPLLSAVTGNGALQTATYDLYPNNNAFNLKGEFARSLPDFFKGRVNATVSWGTSRQNDDLLAPISDAQNAQLGAAGITNWTGTSIGYAANSALVSNWNSTAALSQTSGKQRIDTTLVDLGFSMRPSDELAVKASYRYYDTANHGGYTAYNPLTGQFGRGIADGNGIGNQDLVVGLAAGATPGTAGSCYVPPGYASNTLIATCQFGLAGSVANGANVPVFGQARSTQQSNYGVAADYDLGHTSSLNASLEREDFHRNFRERADTWEDKLKIGYTNRALGDATLRTSFEADRKRGGDYLYRTFNDLGTGLPALDIATQIAKAGTQGYAAVAAGLFSRYSYYFRKYDQADRDQQIFNTRVNYMAREDLDMGATFQAKNINYPNSFYGLEKDIQNSLTLDLNFQPATGQSFYSFYSFQQSRKAMNLNSGVASATNTACNAANLAQYGYAACSDNINGTNGARPLTSAWSSENHDRNNVLGLGYQGEFGKIRFGIDYTYSNSSTNISYTYGSTALSNVAATQAAAALLAGSALPSMTFIQQTLNFNVLFPINKKLSMRMFDRYETGKVQDWHYDGVITGAVANYDSGTLLLDSGPQNYHNNVVGVLFQFKL